MENKTINLWSTGFVCTGDRSKANFHGSFEAIDLKDAIKQFRDTLTDEYSISCIDVERESFWGCKFHDNESDARKPFG